MLCEINQKLNTLKTFFRLVQMGSTGLGLQVTILFTLYKYITQGWADTVVAGYFH